MRKELNEKTLKLKDSAKKRNYERQNFYVTPFSKFQPKIRQRTDFSLKLVDDKHSKGDAKELSNSVH